MPSTPDVLNCDECLGRLTINTVDMHTSAWCVLDVLPLYLPSDYRVGNVLLPGVAGTSAYAYLVDEGHYALPMLLTGMVDQAGVLYADRWTGLQTNLAYLYTNVVSPPASPAATRAATLLMPDATTRTANVQVLPLRLENQYLTKPIVRAMLEIIVPAGRFA